MKDFIKLSQGGPTSFFPRAKNSTPVRIRGMKPLLALFLKTNSQFILSLTNIIQKWQIAIICAQV
jgi:hypothetical protein